MLNAARLLKAHQEEARHHIAVVESAVPVPWAASTGAGVRPNPIAAATGNHRLRRSDRSLVVSAWAWSSRS
jgi:hypothetical protein